MLLFQHMQLNHLLEEEIFRPLPLGLSQGAQASPPGAESGAQASPPGLSQGALGHLFVSHFCHLPPVSILFFQLRPHKKPPSGMVNP